MANPFERPDFGPEQDISNVESAAEGENNRQERIREATEEVVTDFRKVLAGEYEGGLRVEK